MLILIHRLLTNCHQVERRLRTVVISEERRDEIVVRVKNACINEKRQAYWVCTLIDESEVLEAQAAEAIWEDLTKALPMLKIGLVHGRMKPQEKQDIMAAFKKCRTRFACG